MKKYIQQFSWSILILAIVFPFLIIRVFPKFYHASDISDFYQWSQAWNLDWHSIYINCERCNYPFIGTILSGGVMSLLDIENLDKLVNRFRYFLAAFDALNVLLLYWLLNKLNIKYPQFWAGVIGLLPSSWLGSSVWGQIDGVGQSIILLFFILLVWFNHKTDRSVSQFYLFSFLVGFLLSLMTLTKQLIYFSVFSLGVIYLVNILVLRRKKEQTFIAFILTILTFLLPIVAIDSMLEFRAPFISNIQYILSTGSKHGDIISSIGFNIWVLFSDNLLGSSHTPITFRFFSLGSFNIIPYQAGIVLFLLLTICFSAVFLRKTLMLYKTSAFNDSYFVAMALLYLSLINLSFNLTLTGTHERYLYHFYPFIFVALLVLNKYLGSHSYSNLLILFFGSLTYGLFLFAFLNRWIRITSLFIFKEMSIFYLFFLGYLIYILIRLIFPVKLNEVTQ
ncbi:MAG TPA: hypothetical protein PLQ75_04195 [Anaerolineales bacterium]|nr:hypothetical protein [Anaerolineales bacterium]